MRILVVDDHILFRESLVDFLDSQPDFSVVSQAGSVQNAVELASELKPDIVLLDSELPDGSGLDAIKTILNHRPDTKIVMLMTHESEELLFLAIRYGAFGYVLKSNPVSHLLASIRALERDEAALSRRMTGRLLHEFTRLGKMVDPEETGLDTLTSREIEVLNQLGKKASNQEIAECLTIAENTVKVHIRNILNKLDLRNRREAGRFARRHGITIAPVHSSNGQSQ